MSHPAAILGRMDKVLALLAFAEQHHGLFRFGDAARLGLGSKQLFTLRRNGRVERVGPMVYRFTGSPQTWRQRLWVAGPGAVASHFAAAALWVVPRFKEGPIEVLRLGHRSRHGALGRIGREDGA